MKTLIQVQLPLYMCSKNEETKPINSIKNLYKEHEPNYKLLTEM